MTESSLVLPSERLSFGRKTAAPHHDGWPAEKRKRLGGRSHASRSSSVSDNRQRIDPDLIRIFWSVYPFRESATVFYFNLIRWKRTVDLYFTIFILICISWVNPFWERAETLLLNTYFFFFLNFSLRCLFWINFLTLILIRWTISSWRLSVWVGGRKRGERERGERDWLNDFRKTVEKKDTVDLKQCRQEETCGMGWERMEEWNKKMATIRYIYTCD